MACTLYSKTNVFTLKVHYVVFGKTFKSDEKGVSYYT